MTNSSSESETFFPRDLCGLEKWPVTLGFASGERQFFKAPLP